MGLATPETIQTLQRKLYLKAKRECTSIGSGHEGSADSPPGTLTHWVWFALPHAQCTLAHALRKNLVREPDAGDPHVRFDERGRETELWQAGLRR